MKRSDPLLLADITLRWGMYPASKNDITWHLAIPRFPQSDHTVGKLSADADLKSSSNVQVTKKENNSKPFPNLGSIAATNLI